MRLLELVKKTDFTKYYFVIDEKDVKEKQVLLDDYLLIDFENSKPEEENNALAYYDLGKIIYLNKPNANSVARYLDKSRKFKFDFLEHIEGTCYIHLIMK